MSIKQLKSSNYLSLLARVSVNRIVRSQNKTVNSASIMLITVIMIVLSGCGGSSDKLPLYDQAPDVGEPPIQTAYARELNYDILDYESYDSFKHPKIVEAPDGKKLGNGWVRLYRCEDATYLTATYFIPQDYLFFQYSSQSAIIYTRTGDNYMLRKLMYYPTDTCFWIRGCGGKYVQITSVYPPLPIEVEDIELFSPAVPSRDTFNGQAERFASLKVSELRRSTIKDNMLKKGEVIY